MRSCTVNRSSSALAQGRGAPRVEEELAVIPRCLLTLDAVYVIHRIECVCVRLRRYSCTSDTDSDPDWSVEGEQGPDAASRV